MLLLEDFARVTKVPIHEILLFENKKLIKANIIKESNNEVKKYSAGNIKTVKAISNLIKAKFSLIQIKVMLDFPECIPIIFNDYICDLIKLKMPAEMIDNIKAIDLSDVNNIISLSNKLYLISDYMEFINKEYNKNKIKHKSFINKLLKIKDLAHLHKINA